MIISNSIDPEELNIWIKEEKKHQLIDVSEENLLKIHKISSEWIPVGKILQQSSKIRKDIPVVLCCRSGNDSFMLMNILYKMHKFENIFSLKSGITGWKLK